MENQLTDFAFDGSKSHAVPIGLSHLKFSESFGTEERRNDALDRLRRPRDWISLPKGTRSNSSSSPKSRSYARNAVRVRESAGRSPVPRDLVRDAEQFRDFAFGNEAQAHLYDYEVRNDHHSLKHKLAWHQLSRFECRFFNCRFLPGVVPPIL
ncbi:MAG: hypothetical protein OXI87_04060 [Albidovulum sp.]|nr:hypothetical protein [Albidovulum sp.]MDE0530570.1 hypothetical protein [Albidovulum sp.]